MSVIVANAICCSLVSVVVLGIVGRLRSDCLALFSYLLKGTMDGDVGIGMVDKNQDFCIEPYLEKYSGMY